MVNRMYWIAALVCGLALALIFYSDVITNKRPTSRDKAFRRLLVFGVLFCLQDCFWGIAACYYTHQPSIIFTASTIFHISTVIITWFWLDYVLVYLGDKVKFPNRYRYLGLFIVLFQVGLLIVNYFTPTVFYIDPQGQYHTAWWRMFAFSNQYLVYIVTGIIAAFCSLYSKAEKYRYLGVATSALAPALIGYFQFLFPNEPFYSIGYMSSCVIVHLFVVSEDRKALYWMLTQNQLAIMQKQIEEQTDLANTDKLTSVLNRLAYEKAMSDKTLVNNPNFVYVSLDLNGLKNVNDTLGHAAGDELIQGAASCLKKCFEPYGKVYRIGGDEFAALILVDKAGLLNVKEYLQEILDDWHGTLVNQLSISKGYATREEYPYITSKEMAHIADTIMYKDKELYYKLKGVDRRGQSSAITSLTKLYAKILKINLTTDSYQIIKMDEEEKLETMGFSDKISVWMHDFAVSGCMHKDDVPEYLTSTNIENLKQHFAKGNKSLTINYRRRFKSEYKPTFMLIITADDYTDNNQSFFVYVSEVFK